MSPENHPDKAKSAIRHKSCILLG